MLANIATESITECSVFLYVMLDVACASRRLSPQHHHRGRDAGKEGLSPVLSLIMKMVDGTRLSERVAGDSPWRGP